MKQGARFIIQLLVLTVVLYGIHYYILKLTFNGNLYFPLWIIYTFNAILVFAIYSILYYMVKLGNVKTYKSFLILTVFKMIFSVLFLLPLFLGKSEFVQLEVINFFIPYFMFLGFEIYNLNIFLNKS